jgi:hypothetical protein
VPGRPSIDGIFLYRLSERQQGLHDLLPSLLTQLSAHSSHRCDILSRLYRAHDSGKMQPSNTVLTKCLEDMLILPDQPPIYLIMDALNESPITSGIPSAREIDIRNAIEPLTSFRVSLHDQTGQKEDIADYVRTVVYSNSDINMRR